MQSFSAAAYRGKTVRLHARVRVENGDADSHAQLWISVDRAKGAGERIMDRPVAPGDWTATIVSAHVEEDAALLSFGFSAAGHARISVDDVSLEILSTLH
jgi:hypothetical protein